jgi:PKD repeat protein
MKNLLAAGLALPLLLLCTTCGTVRAVQGDYASKAPRLLAVTPTQVVSGQFVDFQAQVIDVTGPNVVSDTTGQTGDVLYFWDFGGGAEPNTSIDPAPRVQIRGGGGSPYDGRLVLTDGTTGDAQEFTFQLFVTGIEVEDVLPTTVQAGSSTTFSAVLSSGNVTTWAWDFGGAGNPGGSTQQSPNVTITDTPGSYEGSVVVGNNFETQTFPFTITVVP